MPLPIKYRTGPESITSYDYVDLASGTGYIVFYGGQTSSSTSISGTYLLSNNAFYSNDTVTRLQVSTTVDSLLHDCDFDVTLNATRIMKGNAIVSVTLGFQPSGASSPQVYYVAKLRKWDGTTETEIVSETSETFTLSAGAAVYSHVKTISMTVPQTTFKKGDVLRLTIQVHGANFNGTWYGFGHDPKDRNDDYVSPAIQTINDSDPTVLEFHAPFRIDT